MAVKNTAKVIIGGKIITLGGYESEEYFQKVASYINKKMDELSGMPGYSRQPMETKHTLLSLNITDDYFKAKKQISMLEEELQNKEKEMYDLKPYLNNEKQLPTVGYVKGSVVQLLENGGSATVQNVKFDDNFL